MAGVLETVWRSARSTHEGYAEFKVKCTGVMGVCVAVLGSVW